MFGRQRPLGRLGFLSCFLVAGCLDSGVTDTTVPGPPPNPTAPSTALALFYVSPSGDDAATGSTVDDPYVTLHRAQTAARAMRASAPLRPIEVRILAGTYTLDTPLVFTPEDAASRTVPVTYTAHGPGDVVLSGAVPIDGWTKTSPSRWTAPTDHLPSQNVRQMFLNGRRQVLARHPNRDPVNPRTAGFLYAETTGEHHGGPFVNAGSSNPDPAREYLSYPEGELPDAILADARQAEIFTVYAKGWTSAVRKIRKHDASQRSLYIARLRRTMFAGDRFYIQNTPGALDAESEWFLDHEAKTIAWMHAGGAPTDGAFVAPGVDELIRVEGSLPYPSGFLRNGMWATSRGDYEAALDTADPEAAGNPHHSLTARLAADLATENRPVRNLHFRGLDLRYARHDAMVVSGAEGLSVTQCRISRVGRTGINFGHGRPMDQESGTPDARPQEGLAITGSTQLMGVRSPCVDCVAQGNDISDVGGDGIFAYGDDNLIDNNHIYNVAVFNKESAGIQSHGSRSMVSRNTVRHMPRAGIFFHGEGHTIRRNEVRHTMLASKDGGAIRVINRNLALTGNVIDGNRVVDVLGYGRHGSAYVHRGARGIYIDNLTSAVRVTANVLIRPGQYGLHAHEGDGHVIEKNIVVHPSTAGIWFQPEAHRGPPSEVSRNVIIQADGTGGAAFAAASWEEPLASFAGNVLWRACGDVRVALSTAGTFEGSTSWPGSTLGQGDVVADPGFADAANEGFALRPDAAAEQWLIRALPLSEIGAYAHASRRHWPLAREAATDLGPDPRPLYLTVGDTVQRESFETYGLGDSVPRRAVDVGQSVEVVEAPGEPGAQALQLVDAPPTASPAFYPRVIQSIPPASGTLRCSQRIYLPETAPVQLSLALREGRPGQSPSFLNALVLRLSPTQAGTAVTLSARTDASNVAVLATDFAIPASRWVRLETELDVAAGTASVGLHGEGTCPTDAVVVDVNASQIGVGVTEVNELLLLANGSISGSVTVDDMACSATP